ncbi:FGGY family carbohydrate kinase [Actinomycetaceae bacterium L2_0104]
MVEYVLGIDLGTSGARAGVYDRDGEVHGFGTASWETSHPKPGWAEQDPDTWWRSTVEAVQNAVRESGVDPADIKALSMDATSCTVVSLDADDNVLRPAIMWMDVRSVEQAERVTDTKHPALKYCGHGPVSAEWGLPKSLWLKEREPDIYERTATLCDQTDWLVNRLSGRWTMSVSHAAGKYLYDRDTGGWPVALYRALDAEDILAKFPKDVLQVGDVVGPILPEVADELGLSPEAIVVEGGIDAYFGAVGLGAAEPGRIALITGSSHVITGQLAKPIYAQGLWGAFTDATVPGYYTIDGGQAATGSLIEWFKRNLAGYSVAKAAQTGETVYEVLTEGARRVPIGCDGLLMLDHFQGNRAPYSDGRSRGMFWGLTLHHTEAHMFRALLEGICFGTEAILELMRDQGVPLEEVIVSGGATKNDLWLQMHADVSNVRLVIPNVTDGPALGSAIVASVGLGLYPDIPSASRAMTSVSRVIEPNPEAHEAYQFSYQAYKDSYFAMRDLNARISNENA